MALSGIAICIQKACLYGSMKNLLTASSVVQLQTAGFFGRIKRTKYPLRGYRFTVELPEKYTTNPIPVQKLGGRDPKTGRVVVKTVGGGMKFFYHWVDYCRQGLPNGEPLVEKIHLIMAEPMYRSGYVALVASGDKKRWIMATSTMKEGDLVRSYSEIPRINVRPNEGDSHPLGALPLGTAVCCVEKFPGKGGTLMRAAGSCGQVLNKVGDHVIVQLPSKRLISVHKTCTAVVGRISNVEHDKTPIGSAQRNRWLGRRPRSGLWHKKDGYCGRKIRPLPPMRVYDEPAKPKPKPYELSI